MTSILLGIISAQLSIIIWQLYKIRKSVIFNANAPTNVYGENLVEGIQNSIARGQRGITTY